MAIVTYLEESTGVVTLTRPGFFRANSPKDRKDFAREIAWTRVRNISKPFQEIEPAYGEVQFELRAIEEPEKKVPGILYDGLRLQRLLLSLLPPTERTLKVQHLVFTSRLIGTFGEDGRYHAHVNLCGYPSIISTSGIVEAPAKPKEYYVLKRRFIEAGEAVPFDLLKEQFAGQFIDYDDPRLTDVLKGYALQCVVYAITKEPFCKSKECRLFDAHWQSEVMDAQLHGERFCKKHEQTLKEIKQLVKKGR